MYKALVPFGLILVGTACSLPDDAGLGELSSGDITKLCEELADFEPVSIDCPATTGNETITYSPGPVPDCEADLGDIPAGCTATVGDQRACIEAIKVVTCDDDLFAEGSPCTAIFDASCIPE